MEMSNSGMMGHGMPYESKTTQTTRVKTKNLKITATKNQNMRPSKHDEVFMLVKQGKKIIVTVGEYKAVNREFDTFEQAEQYISSKPYKLIFNTFQILMNYAEKTKKSVEENTAEPNNN